MDLYEAIKQMRAMSEKGQSFSLSFMSCNISQGRSDGVVNVAHARLRARESIEHNRYAEMMEAYTNLDTMENRHFYQPLLMTFNGEKVTLR